jgi:hypothetical protein
MEELIHTFATPVREADSGAVYIAEAWGRQRTDGLWEGWLEFVPVGGVGVWRTGRETTQSSLNALTYWATGLEAVYLEGAFERASIVSPSSQL